MGKSKKKQVDPDNVEITYGAITVGAIVLLKKTFLCKVTKVEKMKAKKGGFKVRVIGKEIDGDAEIMDIKPTDRKTRAGKNAAKGVKKTKALVTGSKVKSLADFDMSTGVAGASKTIPIRAGEVRKGGFLVMKGKPCKVIEISVSKTGKHGHAKANINGIDVFTGKKYNEISPCSHNMLEPAMFRSEWQLTDIERGSGTMTLMDAGANTRQDLDLPKDNHGEYTSMSQNILNRFAKLGDDKAMHVVVLKAMDTEQVVDMMIKDAA